MKLDHIQEPDLEFGSGVHICPRAGITLHGVYDSRMKSRRERIIVGGVGTSDELDLLDNWLKRCSNGIPATLDSRQPNLRVSFCGFNPTMGFQASFAFNDDTTRSITNSDIKAVLKITDWNKRVEAAVDLYYRHVKFLAQNRSTVDVIVCLIPDELYNKIAKEEKKPLEDSLDEDDDTDDRLEMNFRRALKAKSMHLGKPTQLVRSHSIDGDATDQQDAATKAWNFCTALYYKANKTVPWRLPANVNRPSVCYAGIGFYRSRDRKVLHTSLAQVFDELGNGVILRGTPVHLDRNDMRPHLTTEQSHDLLEQALKEYNEAMDTSPARLVIHNSSNYHGAELDGFRSVAEEMRVRAIDFVTIMDTDLRLLREGFYPPYRGTHIELDKEHHLLYTRGSIKHYQTYTGKYIPQPIEIRVVESDESPSFLCKEVLGLTKMNWNNTQFDGKYPITIACARKVGQVMKYLDQNDKPQISYSFYM